ncbi:MAG: LpqB family beta-propeller domain-containing protein [Planctomycetota bacterium]|nr:LpqB family beta-propeller domain-containing protein [Planctomycetota bacterium]
MSRFLVAALFAVLVTFANQAPSAESTAIQRLTHTYYSKFFLNFSPDGSHLVYSRHHANRRGAKQILVGVRVVQTDGLNDRPLLGEYDASVQVQEHPAFAPGGNQLLITGGGSDTANASKDTFICSINAEFAASDLKKLVAGEGVTAGEEPAWSPDGKRIAYVTTTEQLWIANADGTDKEMVLQVAGQYLHQPAWSPDGQWIAFASDRDGNIDVYKVRWDGTDLIQLTDQPGIDCRPRWSRDGEWLLFTSNRAGNQDVWLMKQDGSALRPLTTHSASDDHGAWSPDGTSIAFVSMRDGGFDIYRAALPAGVEIGPPAKPQPLVRVAEPGLITYYHFEEHSGEQVRDQAGPNHLALHGAKVVEEDGRGSLEFTGDESYAVGGNGVTLRGSGPLTISLWIRPDATGGNGYLISKYGWNIYLGGDLVPRFETRSAKNDAWITLAATQALPPAAWSQVAAVFDPAGDAVLLYVNGQLSSQQPRTDGELGATAGHPLHLGRYNHGTQFFRGRLDEIRIYNQALSANAIKESDAEQRPRVTGHEL